MRTQQAHDSNWYPLCYLDTGIVPRLTRTLDTLFGGGPGKSGVQAGETELRVHAVGFKLTVPRSSVRHAARAGAPVRGTTGVHGRNGHWLVNGPPDNFVRLQFDPPAYLPRRSSMLFFRPPVHSLMVSLQDPDGFIAAVSPAVEN
ncbi:hypothetical protein [Actinospica robiniae]|uniref:hypothetical protein n=1 Tax=Actinospica robiniae TaxID=304901 RepID=UPI00054EC615|nr:hypothetical protein [Actinospica robiniae]